MEAQGSIFVFPPQQNGERGEREEREDETRSQRRAKESASEGCALGAVRANFEPLTPLPTWSHVSTPEWSYPPTWR